MKQLLFTCLVLVLTLTGYSQKRVVVEKFTNAYCGACPGAAVTLSAIVEEHPEVIWLSHHKPVSWIDNGLTNTESVGLWSTLNVPGTPMGMVNRSQSSGGLLAGSLQWGERVDEQLDIEQSFALEVRDLVFEEEDRQLEFTVDVSIVNTIESLNYHLNVVMVEDSVWGVEQHNYFNDVVGHPLEGQGDIIWGYPHRHVVRQILDGQWGTADLFSGNVTLGNQVSKTYQYQVPSTSRLSTFRIVVFVSKYDKSLADLTILDANTIKLMDYGIPLGNEVEIEDSAITLTIAPNPTSDILNIAASAIPQQVFILDNLGRAVYQAEPKHMKSSIDITHLPSGKYSLLARYEAGIIQKGFIVE